MKSFSKSIETLADFSNMFWSVGQSVCRSVGLSVCLSVGRTVCRSVGPSVRLSVCRSVGLSVHRPIGLSVCLSVCRSLGISVCQSVCLFVVFLILVCKILIDFGDAFNCSWGSQGARREHFGVLGTSLGVILGFRGGLWRPFWGPWTLSARSRCKRPPYSFPVA